MTEPSKPALTLIVCMPGNSFSGQFMDCWSDFLLHCFRAGIQVQLSRKASSMVHFVRSQCLGGDVRRGRHQKPFDGKIAYDYLLWIDSDTLFNFEQFIRLLRHKVDVVAGIYEMLGGLQYAVVQDWDTDYFKQHGAFYFLRDQDLEGRADLLEVAYSGMGFMLIKHGVFESLEYPWFTSLQQTITEDIVDTSSEDVSLCWRIREQGFNIYVDPRVRVGHEKTVIL